MTLPGPRCSQAVNVSSLMPSETLSLLAPLCDDEIDNSMSSEIPFTSLNHFRRSVPQTSADVEIPARTAAETTTRGNAVSCGCLLYTSPSPRDGLLSRMPSSA